jgi:hypothetical protein
MIAIRRSRSSRDHFYRDLLVAIAVIVLVSSVFGRRFGGALDNILVAAILVVALVEVARSRRHIVVGAILGLPAIASRLVGQLKPHNPAVDAVVLGLTLAFFAFLIWLILHDLFSEKRPTIDRINGAIAAYFFIGLLFALLYAYVALVDRDSFSVASSLTAAASGNPLSLFTYFSFVTLTTLGYGDITPVSDAARTLAWFEALVGQLYIAVMIGGLVAVHISESYRRSREPVLPAADSERTQGDAEDRHGD